MGLSALIIGGIAAAATMASTGFQIASGIDQANQAKKQRAREAAIQDKSVTKEEKADRDMKQKKKAAQYQSEREAAIGTDSKEQGKASGGLLGSAPGAKQGL